jgi:hypothetical protein
VSACKRPERPARVSPSALRRAGFDRTRVVNGWVLPRCSQCDALAVPSAAVHEHGCPNIRHRRPEAELAQEVP